MLLLHHRAISRACKVLVAVFSLILCPAVLAQEIREEACRLYLAPSTIKGGGNGIFAGIDFDLDDVVLYADIAVPLDELWFHTGGTSIEQGLQEFFIWSDYTWDSSIAGGITFDYLGLGEYVFESVELASFGLGAMPNCKFGFVNLHSDKTLNDVGPLDRTSPGNGAFSPYHERVGYAREVIQAGQELFEDYGYDYFANRPALLHVPHDSDLIEADELLKTFKSLRDGLIFQSQSIPQTMLADLYNLVKGAWDDTRVLNALPDLTSTSHRNKEDFDTFLDNIIREGAKSVEKNATIRDISWLREKGVCMDGIRSGISSIPHAGRGAFATRIFKKGATIAPVPLIHIPNKDILTMYAPLFSEDDDGLSLNNNNKQRNSSQPIGKQLLVNYVFGHEKSTMLLSPYGSITSLINHGFGSDANARMVWATDWMPHPEWLEITPNELLEHRYAGLGWNLVALRDIRWDEEILIDYGPAWVKAWKEHVDQWYSNNGQEEIRTGTSLSYTPASELNDNIEEVLVDAVTNHVDYSYMGRGVTLYCYYTEPLSLLYNDDDDEHHDRPEINVYQECRPVAMYRNKMGEAIFVAEIFDWEETDDSTWKLVVLDTLLAAHYSIFHFEDIPFSAAHRMPWAFRHEMAVPDDLLPKAWMNLP